MATPFIADVVTTLPAHLEAQGTLYGIAVINVMFG